VSEHIRPAPLDMVFDAFEDTYLMARMNYQCCQSCGLDAISKENKDEPSGHLGYVFYHAQDEERREERGYLMLSYGALGPNPMTDEAVGKLICDVLARHGRHFEWDGSSETRIQVYTEGVDR